MWHTSRAQMIPPVPYVNYVILNAHDLIEQHLNIQTVFNLLKCFALCRIVIYFSIDEMWSNTGS